ncbi:hypothetical protein AX17_005475 [Amanita inopinata Kibby_2008]|nr:hypothetical protein AX17_005475 [Amanita inopinata Kibby_2008]
MALRRCTRPVDGTIPVQALLYDDEEYLASKDGVGIYDGQQKAADHQSGVIHISTHRLFYIDSHNELSHSFALDLSLVIQTNYYAGLFKSSPKVTLHLRPNPMPSGQDDIDAPDAFFESWECQVCAYRNPPGLSPNAASICALCGVPRASVPASVTSAPLHHSASLPTSSIASPAPSSPRLIACPACTFLNHPSRSSCEICLTALPRTMDQLTMKSAPTTRPISPTDNDPDSIQIIKLSFRKGGDKAIYAVMKRSLKGKAWQVRGATNNPSQRRQHVDANVTADRNTIGKTGISGILQTVETSAQGEEDRLRDALIDLEALMTKAKDMVRLAAELNEKLTATSTTMPSSSNGEVNATPSSMLALAPSTEPEEATFIRSSLSQLGLQMANAPVTLDMMKDERRWIEELARELAGVLQGGPGQEGKAGIMKDRGIVALDEVWGGWNRARGVALIPPSTFLLAIPLLPLFTNPTIHMRILDSGLTVLHIPPYTQAAFAARLASFLSLSGPQTTIDIAMEEGLSVSLAKEMVEAVESDGDVLRDDANAALVGGGGVGGAQLKWWNNVFEGYVWDGQW